MSDRYCGESNGGMSGSHMNCGERWNKQADPYKCGKCKAYDQGYEDGRKSNSEVHDLADEWSLAESEEQQK